MRSALDGSRIIVVGAGLSGLAAATYVKRRGAEVIVLEARRRLGGRVWTDRSLGACVDLGAAAIHGAIGNALTILAQAASARTAPLNYDSILYYLATGVRIGDNKVKAAAARFERLQQRVRAEATGDESVAQTIRRIAPRAMDDPVLALHAGVEFEFDIGGSLEEIGASKLDDNKSFGGDDLILPEGFDQLVRYLARGIDVRTGFTVENISVSKGCVRVGGASGAVDADYCICTVPLGVLKSRSISFDPELPTGVVEAIDRLGAGRVTKIALRFGRVFWDVDPQFIGYASGRPGRFPYVLNLHAIQRDTNILVTFALGDHDRSLKDQTDEAISRDAVAMLRDIYGEAVEEPSDVRVTRWNSDPFSLCSYSFASTQTQRADFDAFGDTVCGRLLFAGEHTIADHRGTAHGAYLSGKRAANRIRMV